MLTRVHVNAQHLRRNPKHPKSGKRKPVFIVKNALGTRQGNLVVIEGPSRLVYRPDDPLPSGAVAYVVTEANVQVFS